MATNLLTEKGEIHSNFNHSFNLSLKKYQKEFLHFTLFVAIFIFSTEFKSVAQPPTVKEKLSQVTNTVHAIASDAKLILATGDDLSLSGKSDTWIYVFKSEAKNKLYEYWYDEGNVVAKSTISNWEGFEPALGMAYLPDNWLDSDDVISISESNGGSSFRASQGGHAAIRITLLPSAFGSSGEVSFLYPEAAWEISYRQNDNYFEITINAETGEVLTNKPIDERKATAKELLSNMDSLAKELSQDAELFRIWSPIVDLLGESGEWVFEYHSISRHTVFLCTYRFLKIRREGESSPGDHEYSTSIEIPDMWMNSDSAIIVSEALGGLQFRDSHPNTEINIRLGNNESGLPKWDVYYNSPSGSVSYEVIAVNTENLVNKAQTQLEQIKSLAQTYANDAELVFVTSNNISETGDGQWNYVFKSEFQQQVYEFYSTLTGYIGLPEEITQFFSLEDFLNCELFPDSWIDSDSVLIITEESGGWEFRQNYPDWNISAILTDSPYGIGFNWDINYNSEGTGNQLQFSIEAKGKSTTEDWPKTYGGDGADVGQWVQETNDGGFIISGYTRSFGQGMADTWLLKTDSLGNEEWNKTYGGSFDDYGRYVEVTEENEYLIAHNTSDASGVYLGNLLLADSNGVEKLGRSYNNGGNVEAYSIHETIDNSYVLAGSSSMNEGEPSDFWLIKINENGNFVWEKMIGGVGHDICESMQQTPDSGYILFGHTNSYGAGGNDFWLVKTDAEGNKTWDKTFGGELNDEGYSLVLDSDGGYILAGFTESYGVGGQDCYLVKTDENGNEVWSKTYGTSSNENFRDVIESNDGGYIMVGTTNQNGNKDVIVIKTDSEGNEIWTQIIGEEQSDFGRALCQTSDSSIVITGGTRNYGAQGMDLFLMKIEDSGNITQLSEFKMPTKMFLSNYPNPFNDFTNIQFGVKQEDKYKMRVIDLLGNEVNVLFEKYFINGEYEIVWNGQNQNGKKLTPGIYLIEIAGKRESHVVKVILE